MSHRYSLLTAKQKQVRRAAENAPKGPKTVEGRNLLAALAKAQPKLSGLEIRSIRIGASRSTMPSRKRYKMWLAKQGKTKKAA